mmetsp:Transcript_2686/g.8722  ORF Transcript_2686/g.8722 Transcript_2686/m.8722 type:complete len:315 (+) Transcript_2686:1707-2651(+)
MMTPCASPSTARAAPRSTTPTSTAPRAATRRAVGGAAWAARRAGGAGACASSTTTAVAMRHGRRATTRARGGGYLDYDAALAKEFVKVEVPALLFPQRETLLPGSKLTLHLYEARFLALLEKAMSDTGGLIAQLTFLPSDNGDEEGLRVNASATLARIEAVHRAEVGARVEVVGEARMKLEDITTREPYIAGLFTHIPQMGDVGTYNPSDDELAQVKEVTDYIESAVNDVLLLSDKLLGDKKDVANVGASTDVDDDDDDDGGLDVDVCTQIDIWRSSGGPSRGDADDAVDGFDDGFDVVDEANRVRRTLDGGRR